MSSTKGCEIKRTVPYRGKQKPGWAVNPELREKEPGWAVPQLREEKPGWAVDNDDWWSDNESQEKGHCTGKSK